MGEEVFPWLESLPLAPEYHPTVAEFQDPISYIFKIEKEASKYGICKIIPPVPTSSKKTKISNLNQSLSSQNPDSTPTFTTRTQQIGVSPRKHQRSVQKSVWESGQYYTVDQFEARAKSFEKNYLKKKTNSKRVLTPLEVETLYWKAQMGKQFSIEYANDMPGSAFDQTVRDDDGGKQGKNEIGDAMTVDESQWNMNVASKAKGSLLRFMKDEIPGVTSPMVYLSMLFSWFAWHVEDHDFHSLNYMHMGAAKTWYGVPNDAAIAFEDVIRNHGYDGTISPLVTVATLAKKTTIMSPEVLIKERVPCCRLVQKAGEFVVTFPRAYHTGFSHGFNCADATNFATPQWLLGAQDAAIRRVSTNCAPMMSYSQLNYDLALSLSSNEPTIIKPEPQSLKSEELVKKLFLQDVMQQNKLLHVLGKGFPIAVFSQQALQDCFSDSSYRNESDLNAGFSCVTCGDICYYSVAIVQPSKEASRFMSVNDVDVITDNANVMDRGSSTDGGMLKNGGNCLFDVPVEYEGDSSCTKPQEVAALKLLQLAYADSSEEEDEPSSLMNLPHDEGSHVFCLRHAREVEQRLESVGGVHMLLLCHQDYPTIDEEARLMAEELGTDQIWTDLGYREINKFDQARILSALDDEAAHSDKDWVVKLGLDIFHSARLSCLPVHKNQMPKNSVICNAIRHITESAKSKLSGNQMKIVVAGEWCGKVWMSNQVHPLLLVGDFEEQDETSRSGLSMADVKPETETRKKTKMNVRAESLPSPSPPSSPPRRTSHRNKQIRKKIVPNFNKKPRESESDSDSDSGDEYRPTGYIRKRRKKVKKTVVSTSD